MSGKFSGVPVCSASPSMRPTGRPMVIRPLILPLGETVSVLLALEPARATNVLGEAQGPFVVAILTRRTDPTVNGRSRGIVADEAHMVESATSSKVVPTGARLPSTVTI